ncbi:MAG TPA: pyrrolo-quinoline quinone [Burkholderiaceae bacterium]|nr:pyrrolo-quinoline quinone [Burkholderiaceae bacterium]
MADRHPARRRRQTTIEFHLILVAGIACLVVGACGQHGASSSTTTSAGTTPTGNGGGSSGTVPANSAAGVDVLTWHNDNARSGLNAQETVLTPANVSASSFGKLGQWSVDGAVDAQPLYVSGVTLADGSSHDLLLVATEHGSVYAFDAKAGTLAWNVSLLGAGESSSDPRSCGQVSPEIGITSTPVVDRSRGTAGTVYVVAMSKSSAAYFQRLHALDVATGREVAGSPVTIAATYPGSGDNSAGGQVVFDPAQYKERSALLLQGGVVYTTWASHCDIRQYTGWIIGFDAASLATRSVLNVTPNGEGGAFWSAGAGPASDAAGNLYALAGNGTFDTQLTGAGLPAQGDYGNAFLKLQTAGGLAVADYFATFDTVAQSNADSDFGSGGAMVLPDLADGGGVTRHLAVGAGKDGHIYVVNRDAMGHYDPAGNSGAFQVVTGALGGGVFAAPAYFNGVVYYGAVGDSLKAFPMQSARLATAASSRSAAGFGYPGTTPSLSSNGTAAGIAWAVENASAAVLHAYDATDLGKELYNSNMAGSRDAFGAGNKFMTPTVSGGRVYVGTPSGVAVFGLLPPG